MDFAKWLIGIRMASFPVAIESGDELWLAYLMATYYSMIWDGEGWTSKKKG